MQFFSKERKPVESLSSSYFSCGSAEFVISRSHYTRSTYRINHNHIYCTNTRKAGSTDHTRGYITRQTQLLPVMEKYGHLKMEWLDLTWLGGIKWTLKSHEICWDKKCSCNCSICTALKSLFWKYTRIPDTCCQSDFMSKWILSIKYFQYFQKITLNKKAFQ